MAIKYVNDTPESRRKPAPEPDGKAAGEARFATPIEATTPVNPDAGSELPFADLPTAEKKKRNRRAS